MKHKVLWVEDGAFAEMNWMSAPLYVSGKYDLVIAVDATDGLRQLMQKEKEFQTVIVDIRLPPGNDPEFLQHYYDRGESKVGARLGLALLKRVLTDGEKNGIPAPHRQVERFGIFTVEGPKELQGDLKQLGLEKIKVCQKSETNSKFMLRDIIEEIRARNIPIVR
jgi:hypothetical protein